MIETGQRFGKLMELIVQLSKEGGSPMSKPADPKDVQAALRRAKNILAKLPKKPANPPAPSEPVAPQLPDHSKSAVWPSKEARTLILESLKRQSALFAAGKISEHRYRRLLVGYLELLEKPPKPL